MKILFVHEVNYETKVVFEMHEFPEFLQLRGHEICFFDFPENESLRPPRIRTKKRVIRGRANPSAQITLVTPPRVFPFPFDRIFAAVVCGFQLRRILEKFEPEVIVSYSVATTGWQLVRLAKARNIPVLFRAIDVGHQLRPTVFRQLIKWAEVFVYKHSTLIAANNGALADYIRQLGGEKSTSIEIIYPGSSIEIPKLSEVNSTAEEHPRKTRLVFMGTLFRFCGLAELIVELGKKRSALGDFELLIIGDGEARRDIENVAKQSDLEDQIKFAGVVSFDKLGDYLSTCDISLLPFEERLVTTHALPGKVVQYILSDLPTVSTNLTGLQGLFGEGEGVLYRPMGPSYVDAIIELASDSSQRHSVVEQGRRACIERANWKASVDQIEVFLVRLAGHAKALNSID